MSSNIKLKNIFIAASMLTLSACSGMKPLTDEGCMEEDRTEVLYGLFSYGNRSYNDGCALDSAATQMLQSDDIGFKAIGHGLLESGHDDMKKVTEVVRRALMEGAGPVKCTVNSVAPDGNGAKIIRLGSCVPVSP